MNRPGASDGKSIDAEMEQKHADAFGQYLRTCTLPEGFRSGAKGVEVKAMSSDVLPEGGYLVRPQFSETIVSRVFETSPIRQLANVERTSGDSLRMIIDDDEADFNWAGQGAAGSETDTPQLGMKVIPVDKMEARPKLTTEMLEDPATNVEVWLSNKVSDRFSRGSNTAFVSGTGVDQPRGFLTYAAWASAGVYEAGKIEQVNAGASSALVAENLIDVQSSLKEAYQAGATWGMKRATYGKVLQLKGADQFFFGPVMMRDGQAQIQLLGKPVVFMDDMEAVGADNLCVVYADFSRAYTVVDRTGLQVLRDPFTSKGFVEYYTTMRVGGDVTNFDAIKIGKTPS
jgi:HK97 family phage major capsid protein